MNKKILLGAAVFAPFVALLVWIFYTYNVRDNAVEVVLPIQGYDPRDLLSGHYIEYRIRVDNGHKCISGIDTQMFTDEQGKLREWKRGDFACLELYVPGFKQSNWTRPKRFYIPQEHAENLDALFRRRNDTSMRFEVVYAVPEKGEAIPKALLINGVEWQKYLLSSQR